MSVPTEILFENFQLQISIMKIRKRYQDGRENLGKNYVPLENEMELLSIQHELRTKNLRIQVLTEKYNNLKKSFKEMVLNHKSLMGQLKNLHTQKDDNENEIIELTKMLEMEKLENTKLTDMQLENETLKNNVQALEKIRGRLEMMLSSEKAVVEAENEEKFVRLLKKNRTEKMELENKLRSITVDNQNLREENEVLRLKNGNGNKKIVTLENEVMELKSKMKNTEKYDILLIDHEKLGRDHKRVLDENKKREEERKELERINEELKKKNHELEKQVEINKYKNMLIEPEPEKTPVPKKLPEDPVIEVEKVVDGNFSGKKILNFTERNNKFSFNFSTLVLEKDTFPYSHFLPVFLTAEFFTKNICFSELIPARIEDQEFNKEISFKKSFDIEMTDFFVYYLLNKKITLKVFVTSDGQHREIGNCIIILDELINSEKLEIKVNINDTQSNRIGTISSIIEMEKAVCKVVSNMEDLNKLKKK